MQQLHRVSNAVRPGCGQVVPTLLVMLHNGDHEGVPHLTALVAQLRAHLRRWLPDLVHLVTSLWPRPLTQGQQPSKLLLNLLQLLGTLAGGVGLPSFGWALAGLVSNLLRRRC